MLATTRGEAIAAANALVTNSGFGGEAASFLTAGELASLANFQFGTLAAVLSTGKLTITDTDATGKNNTLTVTHFNDGVNDYFEITDSTKRFSSVPVTTPVSALVNGGKTLRVPLSAITGSITINGSGGNDVLTIDLSGGDAVPDGAITFNGDNPTTEPGDGLIISGGSQGTVSYNYTNASDGSVAMSYFGTVHYTGLEPITNTGIATDVIFNLPAGLNSATLSDDGTDNNGLSRLSGATFEQTDFSNPTGSLTINRGSSADQITVASLPDFNASLTFGSVADPFATVQFVGAVTLAANQNLAASASGTMTVFSVPLTTSGTGTVSLTTSRNIQLNSGSMITTVDGGIALSANSDGTAVGNFKGLVQTMLPSERLERGVSH